MWVEQGWLRGPGISHKPSPNFDKRPDMGSQCAEAVRLLVIHNISLPPGVFGGCYIDQLFTNCLNPAEHDYFAGIAAVKVSAHVLIDRVGQITQYVSLHDRAWHAGASSFQGASNCNDFSIGIELEGTDDLPYTDAQYTQLARLSRQIMQQYPGITIESIVGHSDIAPGRKTDPGPSFDWQRYRALITEKTQTSIG